MLTRDIKVAFYLFEVGSEFRAAAVDGKETGETAETMDELWRTVGFAALQVVNGIHGIMVEGGFPKF